MIYDISKNIYIALKTSINVYIHLSDYWSGRKLKKIELSCTIKFSVFQAVAIAANSVKCMVSYCSHELRNFKNSMKTEIAHFEQLIKYVKFYSLI
jgi:hypothetical protein